MAENNHHYKLRCTLLGHSSDVRAITTTNEGHIITSSRDHFSKLWCEDIKNKVYQEKITYKGHAGYVTSVCYIPNNNLTDNDYIATGSRDSTILIFPINSSEAQHVLTGHTDTVSCIAWKDGVLVSGSWDHSIKVWKNWECSCNLEGHSGPVWSIIISDFDSSTESFILSASADKTIKCWKNGKNTVTYSGHSECVRGLALWDSDKFLSCSNDASIKMWKLSGECLATYFGHTNFIYGICCIRNSQRFITCGEDRTVRVWDSTGLDIQTIHLPAQSVWTVSVLPNDDIVVGTSDGACRVFTLSEELKAPIDELKEFEESLSKFKVAIEDIGGIKKSNLPDKSFLLTPGKRDGQTVMVNEDDKIMSYNWSSAKGEWVAIGEVVGGTGGSINSSGKVLYQGREYDYVFDVDLDEGRLLKLPYNIGEDPWIIAQTFIHDNDLPQDYLDQVANFITKNANVTSQSIQQSENFDPFTGSSRYIPSTNSLNNNGERRDTDPFTGGGRHVPSYSETESTENSSQFFPQLVPLKFDSFKKDGILNKMKESNALCSAKLTNEQIEVIVDEVTSSKPNADVLGPLEVALQWPPENVWPALDVLRLALRSRVVQDTWIKGEKGSSIINLLLTFLLDTRVTCAATHLLSLRCLSNLASHPPGREILINGAHRIIGAVAGLSPYINKNIEIAAATLIINYSVILRESGSLEDQCQALSSAATIGISASDSESIFRALVAIGTLISKGGGIKSLSKSLDLKTIVKKHALINEPQKVGECARHLLRIL